MSTPIDHTPDIIVRDTPNGGVDLVFHIDQGDLERSQFVRIVAFYAGMLQTGVDASRSYAEQALYERTTNGAS
nr:MAG TPA: hypothetical protein [Caudoviricetes sp.]